MTPTDDDEPHLRQAVDAGRRLVAQSRAHVAATTKKLSRWIDAASRSSPCGIDKAAAGDVYGVAFEERIRLLRSMSNALLSHLRGVEALLKSEPIHPLPAVSVARSAVEVAASCAWLMAPTVGVDERAARAYAAEFRSIDEIARANLGTTSHDVARLRELLIERAVSGGVQVRRHTAKDGSELEEVAQVTVKRSHAKTGFQHTQRIAAEVPGVGNFYAHLSAIAHGDSNHTASAFDAPDSIVRVVTHVAYCSVSAWSRAVHGWVGVEPAPFLNGRDRELLRQSAPLADREAFEAEDRSP